MFFRREKPKEPTFQERLQSLTGLGFTVQNGANGLVLATRRGCGAEVEDVNGAPPKVKHTGVMLGNELGVLVDAGFQKFFLTPSGKKMPASADHLKAMHQFAEDLREGLGVVSFYNESLGTTNNNHMYDRVTDRDKDRPRKPWEVDL
jgi:hypothetical protein